MSEAFLMAVIDTVLPGEARAHGPAAPLPPGSSAGLHLDANGSHAAIIRRIAGHSGEDGFVAADPAGRAAILADVEKESFEAFRALVTSLLQDYYETPGVLAAMGWRAGGAQPEGHAVPEADAATLRLLERVRARGPIWRDPGRRPR
jgi:hypothetical protein